MGGLSFSPAEMSSRNGTHPPNIGGVDLSFLGLKVTSPCQTSAPKKMSVFAKNLNQFLVNRQRAALVRSRTEMRQTARTLSVAEFFQTSTDR